MPDLWVPLSVHAMDDERIMEVGEHAECVYYRALQLAKRRNSDGFIARAQLRLIGDEAAANALTDCGLWTAVDGGWLISSWLKHNKPRSEIDAQRERENQRKAEWRARRRTAPNVPPDATRDTSSRDDGTEVDALEGQSEAEQRESRASVPPDATRDTSSRALKHFIGTMGARFDIDQVHSCIELVEARGYTSDEIAAALRTCEWPSQLTRTLPQRAREVGASVPLQLRPDCAACANTGWIAADTAGDSSTRCECNPARVEALLQRAHDNDIDPSLEAAIG